MTTSRSLRSRSVVGRVGELQLLRAGLEAAAIGRGSTIVLTGEAGVGKTRLLHEVQAWCADRGGAVLVGRAVDTATVVPFRPLAEALLVASRGGLLADHPDVAPFRNALAHLAPDGTPPTGPPPSVLHVAEGFLRVARSRAVRGCGTTVLLDDLHWADPETLAVVEYLADNVGEEPVLLIVATRPGGLAGFAASIDRRSATMVALQRLGEADVATLTRSCLGDAAVPAQVLQLVVERADGLPFFVEELLAGLESDGVLVRSGDRWVAGRSLHGRPPPTFRDSVRTRMALLRPAHRQVMYTAALLGRQVENALVAAIAVVDPTEVDAALRAAAEVNLVESHELGHRFRHALTRDALIGELSPVEQVERSRAALGALLATRPDLPGELLEVAADLADVADDRAAGVELLMAAARRAFVGGALTSAESAQRRALALVGDGPERWEVVEALVTTLGLAGRAEEVVAMGADLLDHLTSDVDPEATRRVAVRLALARAAVATAGWEAAAQHLAAARGLAVGAAVKARMDALEAGVALGQYRIEDASRLAARAVASAEQAGDPDLLCESLMIHGRCLRVQSLQAAIEVHRRAVAVAADAGLAHREARALTELGVVSSYLDGHPGVGLAARAHARACGALQTEAVAETALSATAWFRADVDAMVAHAEAGLTLAHRYRLGQLVPMLLVCKASGVAQQGRTAEVEALIAEAERFGCEPLETIAALAHARAACAFATGDTDAAVEHLRAAVGHWSSGGITAVMPMLAVHPLAEAAGGGGPPPIEGELLRWSAGACRIIDGPLAAAVAVRAGRAGDPSATAQVDDALAKLDTNQFLLAVCSELVAAAADGWGDRARWLSAAHDAFERLGLPAAAARCRPRGRAGVEGCELTDREQEVLALVKEGLSNRAIAARLFLSARTVEKHVERLLAKTGQNNRAQLATYAVRQERST